MTFGELVRQERKASKMTQQALADSVKVSKMTIRRIEAISTKEELESVNLKTLLAISEVLKSYDIWSLAVGGHNLSENDPDVGPHYFTLNELQREYGFSSAQIRRKIEMDYVFAELNDEGQQKAYDYVVDLSGNPKYAESVNSED